MMKKGSKPYTCLPGFISVRIKRPPLLKCAFSAMIVLSVIIIIAGLVIGLTVFRAAWVGALPAFIFICVTWLIIALPWHEKTLARMEDVISRHPANDLHAVAQEVSQLMAWTSENPPLLQLPDVLIRKGILGRTLQAWRTTEPDPIEPLPTAFEPRLLNESDEGFDELVVAAETQDHQSGSHVVRVQKPNDDLLHMGWILRNIRVKGGWPTVGVLAFFSLIGFYRALMRGSMTWGTMYFPTLLLMIVLIPARTSFSIQKQWLLICGGILMRSSSDQGKKVKLHVFDRRRSVLCCCQRHKGTWLLSVADADASETTIITDRERNLLLRAWLSPMEPPPVEKLGDWA